MPTPLSNLVDSVVDGHTFFTQFLTAQVQRSQKRHLAAKLFCFEARGRPVPTSPRHLARLDDESEWPEIGGRFTLLGGAAVRGVLDRFVGEAFVAGEAILQDTDAFPSVYWAGKYTSGSQWTYFRQIVLAFNALPSQVTVTAADLQSYQHLLQRPNDGYSSADRANLIMNYNSADRSPDLPGRFLASTPMF